MRFLLVLYIILSWVHSFNCLRSIFWLSSSTPLRLNGQSYIFPCLLNYPLAIYLVRWFHPRRQRHQRRIVLSSLANCGCTPFRYRVNSSTLSSLIDRWRLDLRIRAIISFCNIAFNLGSKVVHILHLCRYSSPLPLWSIHEYGFISPEANCQIRGCHICDRMGW